MKSLEIYGPAKISGSIVPGGNKNAALPIIAAALLTEEEVVIHNMPQIRDVNVMLELAQHAGAVVTRSGTDVTICAANIHTSVLPRETCAKVRGSILFAGSLTKRCGSSEIGLPGGDFIGKRRLDSHYYGLEKLGIKTSLSDGFAKFKQAKRAAKTVDMFLDEASVTGTEQILIAAAGTGSCTTIIRNAASEPHVQQLAEFLRLMGADIEGDDTNTLIVRGKTKLHGAEYTIDSDHIEIASFLSLAAALRGGIEFEGKIRTHHYWMTRRVFERFGIKFKLMKDHIVMPPNQRLIVRQDAGNAIPVISDGPWPQFPSDMMSCLLVAATQAKGTTLFFEKMFESRMYFVDRLIAMGANAIVCDPHRAVITGPAKLHGLEMASPDIRAGMALVIAACCAEGKSIVNNADMIYRGYENLVPKLCSIGVDVREIEKIEKI